MVIEAFLIRSGFTGFEKQRRYLGKIDEPLCEEGVEQLKFNMCDGKYREVERVYTASSERCRQTAAIIYSGRPAVIAEGLSPFDYGRFGGRSYFELREDSEFLGWVSGEAENPPGAEDNNIITYRNVAAFRSIMKECEELSVRRVAIITHKSAITSVLRRMCLPRSVYQNVSITHGGGVCLSYNTYANAVSPQNFF